MNKYRNKKILYKGIKFDSQKEFYRYLVLEDMMKKNKISDLRLQVPYVLIDKSCFGRAIKYVADFVYKKDNQIIVEDVKGVKTPVYRLKKRMLAERYGIEIKEV